LSSGCDDRVATLDELVAHGLKALKETLQQEKKLTKDNLTVGFVGKDTKFTIVEGDGLDQWLSELGQGDEGDGGDGGDAGAPAEPESMEVEVDAPAADAPAAVEPAEPESMEIE